MLNDERIQKLIAEHNENESKGYYFYAIVTDSAEKIITQSKYLSLINKYYIINITEKKIHLYAIDMAGNPQGYSYIPMNDVKNIKISNWMFGLGKKINITLKEGRIIKLKANKFTAMLKKQKENLLKLEHSLAGGKIG